MASSGWTNTPISLPFANRAEASLAAGMGSEVGLRGVGNDQHVPSDRTPGGQLTGIDQHFVPGDRLVVEEVVEPAGLAAVAGQHVQAHSPRLLLSRPAGRRRWQPGGGCRSGRVGADPCESVFPVVLRGERIRRVL
jgi:hypothetical protein